MITRTLRSHDNKIIEAYFVNDEEPVHREMLYGSLMVYSLENKSLEVFETSMANKGRM